MKKLLIVLVVIGLWSCSKNGIEPNQVPDAVMSSFKSEYPTASNEKWSKGDTKEDYEVEFDFEGKKWEVEYDKKGDWKEKEYEIKFEDLPQAAKDYISLNYSGADIEETEKVWTKEETYYEVEFDLEDKEYEVYFDSEGNFIKEEVEESHDCGNGDCGDDDDDDDGLEG